MVGWAHSWYLPGSGAVHNKQPGPLLGGQLITIGQKKLLLTSDLVQLAKSSLAARFLSN